MIVLFVTILLVSFNPAAESEPDTEYMRSVILTTLPDVFHTLGWPCHRYGSCHRCCFPRSGAWWSFKSSPTPDRHVGSCITDARPSHRVLSYLCNCNGKCQPCPWVVLLSPAFTSQNPSPCLLPDGLLVIIKNLPVSSSPVLGLQAFPTILWFSVWVLRTKFMSSGSPSKHFTSWAIFSGLPLDSILVASLESHTIVPQIKFTYLLHHSLFTHRLPIPLETHVSNTSCIRNYQGLRNKMVDFKSRQPWA